MKLQGQCFPYEKSIVINALYDAIEALGLCLVCSDSLRGTLTVSDAQHMGNMRITLSVDGNKDHTQVDIIPDNSNVSMVDAWSPIILDELSATIQRARHTEQNCKKEGENL
jgi:hypothetical protein